MGQVTGTEDGENVIVATLVRGSKYTFHDVDPVSGESRGYLSFDRSVPVPVSEEIADKLEDLTEEVPDRDGDLITKDVFRIERDTPPARVAPVLRKKRLRIVSEDVEERPVRTAPARKPLAAPAKKPGTFGQRRNAG